MGDVQRRDTRGTEQSKQEGKTLTTNKVKQEVKKHDRLTHNLYSRIQGTQGR